MKKVFVIAALLAVSMAGFCQQPKETYQKNGKTYLKLKEGRQSSSSYVPTNYWVEYKGQDYQVYSHKFTKGKRQGETGYFIRVKSAKTGKEYWKEVKL